MIFDQNSPNLVLLEIRRRQFSNNTRMLESEVGTEHIKILTRNNIVQKKKKKKLVLIVRVINQIDEHLTHNAPYYYEGEGFR